MTKKIMKQKQNNPKVNLNMSSNICINLNKPNLNKQKEYVSKKKLKNVKEAKEEAKLKKVCIAKPEYN